MKDHYLALIEKLVRRGLLRLDMRVLVLCGGKYDQETLLAAGFKHVTISNLDVRMKGNEYAPFDWSFQDTENINFPDNSFDLCIVHDGLHHCASPHRGLIEMYRVAKEGILVFDPRDSFVSRLGVRLNFGQEYEVAAVHGNGGTFGGIRNTEIPNFVYRWTEREVKKTMSCAYPYGRHHFHFFYILRLPLLRFRMMKNKLYYWAFLSVVPFIRLLTWIFPGQCNTFAFAVFKPRIPEDLHPWIRKEGEQFRVNKQWLEERYTK